MKKRWQNPEYRKKVIEAHTGIKQSPETIEKRKKSIAMRSQEQKEETIHKLSEAGKKGGLAKGKNAKKIMCIESGIIYISFGEASEKLGINRQTISKATRGIRESAGGYHFCFEETTL